MLYFYLITTIILKKTKSILREKISKKIQQKYIMVKNSLISAPINRLISIIHPCNM